MSPENRSTLIGVGSALLAFGLFASHDVIVKILGAHYAPFQIIFFSVLLSFPLATLMLMRDATTGNLRPVHPWWSIIRAVAVVITGSSAFYAFSNLPLAQVYAVLFATPLVITVLSIPVLGERVGLHRWVAVVLGLVGVLVVLQPGSSPITLGHVAALVAAVGSATASVIVRKIGREERAAVLMLYPMVMTFVIMACLQPLVYQPLPVEHLGLLAIIAILAFLAGLCMIAAYRAADAAVVAPMQYSQILWAAIYGVFIFDESITRATFVGASIIIASGLYIVARESLKSTSEHTPVLRTRSRFETGAQPRISSLWGVRRFKSKITRSDD